MQELHHEACEALECSGDPNGWADFDQDTFCGMDIYLELASLVDRRV